jgi:hypothetical protein
MSAHREIRPDSSESSAWWLQKLLSAFALATFAVTGVLPDNAFAASFGRWTGSMAPSSPTMIGRIARNGTASGCGIIKPYPGDTSAGEVFQYETNAVSVSTSFCVGVRYLGGTCGDNVFLSVYRGAFDPSNRATNYLGDIGSSTVGRTMGVEVEPAQTFTFVMNRTDTNTQNCTFIVEFIPLTATHDANADYNSDIFWRDSSGNTAVWLMSNISAIATGSYGVVPTTWAIVGQRDFNLDGKYDLLWRDSSTGTVALWLLNGLQISQTGSLGAVPADWTIFGTGDFDGDQRSDVLWRHSDGTVAIWGGINPATFQVSSISSLGAVPGNWQIVGAADFNGDGRADILWRDSNTGTVAIWVLDPIPGSNGVQVSQSGTLGAVPGNWVIAGTGDFNGDGKHDILWRDSSTGTVAIWFLNGLQISETGSIGSAGGNWVIAATGDYRGSGRSDILWRDNNSGAVALWSLNGLQVTQTAVLGTVPTTWSIQGLNAD